MRKRVLIGFVSTILLASSILMAGCTPDVPDLPDPDDIGQLVGATGNGETGVKSLVYKLLEDGTYAVEKCTDYQITKISIPKKYDGRPVSTIGNEAFSRCDDLKEVTIPDSIVSIEEDAFVNTQAMELDGDIYYVDGWAVGSTETITTANIRKGTRGTAERAFCDRDSLTTVTMQKGLIYIGESSFTLCDNISSVTLPDTLTTIGADAFSSCISLASITFPDSVTTIERRAFAQCDSLNNVTIPRNLTALTDHLFYHCDSLSSITIPGHIKVIPRDIFAGCYGLTGVVIEEGVTTIEHSAFVNCSNLASISLPSTIESIGDHSFDYTFGTVTYNGTMQQFHDINLESNRWYGRYKVVCTDGIYGEDFETKATYNYGYPTY